MKKRIKVLTPKEMNELLANIKTTRQIIYEDPNERTGGIGYKAYIVQKLSKIEVTVKLGSQVATYVCKLDGSEDDTSEANGLEAFRIGQHYYKVPEYSSRPFSARALLWYNKNYERQRVNAYMYDINSAYATVMATKRFPDTSVTPQAKVVGKDEIGFNGDGELIHEGGFAYWVFPLMESPYKKFVETWYSKKKNAKNKKEKTKAKAVLNYYVGMLQRHNCFLRAFIVNSCNELIKNLIDPETTLMSNTDSIVSTKPLPNLKVGEELGEWKMKTGCIAYIGNNYQWNDEIPKYRGVPKGWFKKDFDILTDKIPSFGNIYTLNKEILQVTEVHYE